MYEPAPDGWAAIVWRYDAPTASISTTSAAASGSESPSASRPASTSTLSIASGPYATDDSRSEASTGSATSFRIFSCTTALLGSGGPITTRCSDSTRRPKRETGSVACSVASSVSGPSSSNILTRAKRPNRPDLGAPATRVRLGSTGSARRAFEPSSDDRVPVPADLPQHLELVLAQRLDRLRRTGRRGLAHSGTLRETRATGTWVAHVRITGTPFSPLAPNGVSQLASRTAGARARRPVRVLRRQDEAQRCKGGPARGLLLVDRRRRGPRSPGADQDLEQEPPDDAVQERDRRRRSRHEREGRPRTAAGCQQAAGLVPGSRGAGAGRLHQGGPGRADRLHLQEVRLRQDHAEAADPADHVQGAPVLGAGEHPPRQHPLVQPGDPAQGRDHDPAQDVGPVHRRPAKGEVSRADPARTRRAVDAETPARDGRDRDDRTGTLERALEEGR